MMWLLGRAQWASLGLILVCRSSVLVQDLTFKHCFQNYCVKPDRRLPRKLKTIQKPRIMITFAFRSFFWFCDFGVVVFSDDACAQQVERSSPGLGRVIRKKPKITKPKNDLKQKASSLMFFVFIFVWLVNWNCKKQFKAVNSHSRVVEDLPEGRPVCISTIQN